MRNRCITRATWLLPVLVLASPLLVLPAGHNRSAAPAKEEQTRESPEMSRIVDQIIKNENQYYQHLKGYSPRVETYIQYYRPDNVLGDVATADGYFLGRLKFARDTTEVSLTPGSWTDAFRHMPAMRAHLRINDFAVEPLVVDAHNFDRAHYAFLPVRWEYLGDVRCLAIDVHPRGHANGEFKGRIWVEDHDFAIVRLNGTRVVPAHFSFFVHFDCWRENLQPGLWLPVYTYSQESDLNKRLRYKAETRLWGYDLSGNHQQDEWTNIMVEASAPVHDNGEATSDLTPVESQRQLTIDAEHNVLDRLEKARLVAPPGPVDKVLETVVKNLIVTNHLDNLPPIQCRVMLTSSLESFSLAYTIVLSRGLIDVLPDEASLAMVLAHELAHIALGQKLNTKYAFNDRLQVSDEKLLGTLDLARDRRDELAADAKGIEFLNNSPYKQNLGQAGLFLRAAVTAAPRVPHLFGPHLGNGLTEGSDKLIRMAALMTDAPALTPKNVSQIAALPLGSRVEVNAWNGSVGFTDRKAVAIVDASEKLSFRVTPIVPYLRVYAASPKVEVSERN